jgi:hypothetical protein
MGVNVGKQSEDPRQLYCTPRWATRAFMEKWGDAIPKGAKVWEPACGYGDISEAVKECRPDLHITSSDIEQRSYGLAGSKDFLTHEPKNPSNIPDVIITNPPYRLATAFISKSLQLISHKEQFMVALFMPLSGLAGQARATHIYKTHPPTQLITFSERVTIYPHASTLENDLSAFRAGEKSKFSYDKDGKVKKASTVLESAWFIWSNMAVDKPQLDWFWEGTKEKHMRKGED